MANQRTEADLRSNTVVAGETLSEFNLLKAKLERGAAQAERGDLFDGDEVFAELLNLIENRRRAG